MRGVYEFGEDVDEDGNDAVEMAPGTIFIPRAA